MPISFSTENPVQPSVCNNCPGVDVLVSDEECKCSGAFWWNGSVCVGRIQCPCQVGQLFYLVGTIFEKEDCSRCLCTLGGTAQCEPKQCEPCEKVSGCIGRLFLLVIPNSI